MTGHLVTPNGKPQIPQKPQVNGTDEWEWGVGRGEWEWEWEWGHLWMSIPLRGIRARTINFFLADLEGGAFSPRGAHRRHLRHLRPPLDGQSAVCGCTRGRGDAPRPLRTTEPEIVTRSGG